jgi:predicted nuclease of restriction endonuclease-like (RecB) superfamily
LRNLVQEKVISGGFVLEAISYYQEEEEEEEERLEDCFSRFITTCR